MGVFFVTSFAGLVDATGRQATPFGAFFGNRFWGPGKVRQNEAVNVTEKPLEEMPFTFYKNGWPKEDYSGKWENDLPE